MRDAKIILGFISFLKKLSRFGREELLGKSRCALMLQYKKLMIVLKSINDEKCCINFGKRILYFPNVRFLKEKMCCKDNEVW